MFNWTILTNHQLFYVLGTKGCDIFAHGMSTCLCESNMCTVHADEEFVFQNRLNQMAALWEI